MSMSSATVAIPQSAFTPRSMRARALFLALPQHQQELMVSLMEAFQVMTPKGQAAISLLMEALAPPPVAFPARPRRLSPVPSAPLRSAARRGKAAAPVRD
jgi:hypothetical protein